MRALWLKLLRPRTLHLTRIFKSECGGVGEAESSVRSAMFIATTRSPGQALEERHVSWLGDWPVSPTPIGTCRSYGAWLNTGGSACYKHGAANGASAKGSAPKIRVRCARGRAHSTISIPSQTHGTSARKNPTGADEDSPTVTRLVNMRLVAKGVHASKSGEADRTSVWPGAAATVKTEFDPVLCSPKR